MSETDINYKNPLVDAEGAQLNCFGGSLQSIYSVSNPNVEKQEQIGRHVEMIRRLGDNTLGTKNRYPLTESFTYADTKIKTGGLGTFLNNTAVHSIGMKRTNHSLGD